MSNVVQEAVKDDVWIHSACDMCFNPCGIMVHRVDGVVTKIEGDPDSPHNWGKVCAKGHAAIMSLYDPSRVTKPLKRTNPKKGIGVDPKWMEITWDEALTTIAERLKKIRNDNPKKLLIATFDTPELIYLHAWASAFGTPNASWIPANYYCGAALHQMSYVTNASFHSELDLDHCNYCILIGNQMGFQVGLNPNLMTQKMADARMRGMKLVVIDPRCSPAAAKADEWIPIRPGTDGALSLSMLNVLLNELEIYDVEFLKKRSNAPYLVDPDGYYIREPNTKKPLVWDTADGKAKTYDADLKDPAIEGTYEIGGVACHPAFRLLRDHVKKYTPEMASEITSIPAETIRRIAKEFGQAASIGSKIVIDGVELPYRPVAINSYKGAFTHKHGAHAALSTQLLNLVLGAIYVPGGHRGVNPVGPFWAPKESPDGTITPADYILHGRGPYDFLDFENAPPQDMNLKELFPTAHLSCCAVQMVLLEPERFKLSYQPEMLIQGRVNMVMSMVVPEQTAEALRRIPFMASFATVIGETEEFADIVLPDLHQLERLDIFPNMVQLAVTPSSGYWYWGIRQPVVRPVGEARHWMEVLLELADRSGFTADLNQMLNMEMDLKGPQKLDPSRRYAREEILDRRATSMLGAQYGLEWFKEHGYHKVKRTVEETYPGPFLKPKIPVYFEHFKKAGNFVDGIAGQMGITWDTSDYTALMDWNPCPAYEEKSPEFDLYAVNYKTPFHTFTHTGQNPWLNEIAERHPSAYKVEINAETAEKKGIKNGDMVWIETKEGHRVKGKVKVTECVHPEVVAIGGCFGHWARGKPVAKGKGIHFNSLLALTQERVDMVSAAVDTCVKVRVYKTGP